MSPRQKVKDLVELAVDERTPKEERLSAALKAVMLIHKYDLLANPLDGVFDRLKEDETVQAAKTVMDTVTDPKFIDSVKKIGRRFQKRRR